MPGRVPLDTAVVSITSPSFLLIAFKFWSDFVPSTSSSLDSSHPSLSSFILDAVIQSTPFTRPVQARTPTANCTNLARQRTDNDRFVAIEVMSASTEAPWSDAEKVCVCDCRSGVGRERADTRAPSSPHRLLNSNAHIVDRSGS